IRIYSGTVESGQGVFNARLGRVERVGRLFQVHANSRDPIEKAEAGQIIACMGLKQSATGDTLCTKEQPITYGATTFAEPVISQAIEPKSTGDRDRLGEALGVIARADQTFRARTYPAHGQTITTGIAGVYHRP